MCRWIVLLFIWVLYILSSNYIYIPIVLIFYWFLVSQSLDKYHYYRCLLIMCHLNCMKNLLVLITYGSSKRIINMLNYNRNAVIHILYYYNISFHIRDTTIISFLREFYNTITQKPTSIITCYCYSFRVLEHFNTTAEEYDLIFTPGATAALRLIAEYFKWNPGQRAPVGHSTAPTTTSEGEGDKAHQCKEVEGSHTGAFVYVQENHTSVLGMRGPANEAGCDVYCLPTSEAIDLLKGNDKSSSECSSSPSSSHITQAPSTPIETSSHIAQNEETQGQAKRRNCLFAYSGQCNYSGSKAPLEWIKEVQDGALNSLLSTPPINKDEATGSNSENKG